MRPLLALLVTIAKATLVRLAATVAVAAAGRRLRAPLVFGSCFVQAIEDYSFALRKDKQKVSLSSPGGGLHSPARQRHVSALVLWGFVSLEFPDTSWGTGHAGFFCCWR